MGQQGDRILLGSFHMAGAAARANDELALAALKHVLDASVGDELGSAPTPTQRPALTTRPGPHAHGLPQQRRNDDDEPEQLTYLDGSDGDDGGGEVTSMVRAGRGIAQQKAPAAGTARGSKADCARYVGVYFRERKANPFQASIVFTSKSYHICYRPTAEAAARAYDAVACMIPGRALNFPTPASAPASSSRQRKGASAVPSESDIRAAIAAVRQAQPQLPPMGASQYVGVSIDKRTASYPYQARIEVDGETKHLGFHLTAEAAARAYDAVAYKIPGRRLNFPTGGISAASTCGGIRMDARPLPYRGAGQPSQPPRVAHNDDGSPATAASACGRKREQPSSS
jgi:hypothetical protein